MNPIIGATSTYNPYSTALSVMRGRIDATTPRTVIPRTNSAISPGDRMPTAARETILNHADISNFARATYAPVIARQLLTESDNLNEAFTASFAAPAVKQLSNTETFESSPMFVTAA